MITIALDTCLGACSVAVLGGDDLLDWMSEPMMRGHQERLASMTRELMSRIGLPFAALDRIGATVGPGSFTGLRVGLAFAKGLALALDRPCVGVGTLQALAASVDDRGARVAVIDAGRGNVFLQRFEADFATGGPYILPLGEASARLADVYGARQVTLVGPGAGLLIAMTPGARLNDLPAPLPAAVAALAARAPLVPPRPLYLRPPDALPQTARLKTARPRTARPSAP